MKQLPATYNFNELDQLEKLRQKPLIIINLKLVTVFIANGLNQFYRN